MISSLFDPIPGVVDDVDPILTDEDLDAEESAEADVRREQLFGLPLRPGTVRR